MAISNGKYREHISDHKGISHLCGIYRDIIKETKKVKYDTSKLIIALTNLIREVCNVGATVDFLMHVFVTKNSEKQTAVKVSGFNKHLNQNLYT